MKKKYCLFLSLFFTMSYGHQKGNSSKIISYMGSFYFPGSPDEQLPTIPAYYKGNRVPTQEGAYFFSDSHRHTSFSIIISLLKQPDANTIARFEIPEGTHYLHYALSRKPKSYAPDNKEDTWAIHAEEGVGPVVVPEESLVILMDPACIAGIKPVHWTKEGHFLKLPTIVFKDNLDKDALYARALFANLDVAQFHKSIPAVALQQDKKSISSLRKT